MSAEDKFEVAEEPHATGHRWMVPMDFSFQANAALDWVFSVMKAEDHLLILNVLNLKAPTYAHDIAVNEKLKKESQEKLAEMKKRATDMGYPYVNTLCVRGEPPQQVCKYAVEDKIDCIVMGRRGMSNLKRMLNGSVSEYVLANAPCAVCIMGKNVEEKVKAEELKKMDEEIAELSASCSENEGEGDKVPMFLPRKHSEKNYYTDSD
ncbi:adenine nucleotide alpha hydrolases-like protein [Blastocystis sp. ATCC 50177/Nand II]|uniref:Adenine nucleotide alpha hydrolases-like protein n=1 Tax=Blastocystis sp. subtype 1 (strain ATCC 50177 / NandII) TaxID=478820 RepID=A0A196SKH0_BLAHN|nr:adenine nucleotide alpha hydrolases-like protein [Blastocystis sp. ATCC 50177/Nand II]